MASVTVPGKVFLMGEYSVLQGGIALLATLRPGYVFSYPDSELLEPSQILPALPKFVPHPESPLGRYVDEAEEKQIYLERDLRSMAPGFGTSTAELIAGVMADLGRLPETKRLWAWYRDTFPKASGADLVVQMDAIRTQQALFLFDRGDTRFLEKTKISANLHLFQVEASEKLPTHEALKNAIPQFDLSKCNAWVKRIAEAFQTQSLSEFTVLNDFADYLHECGVETPMAREIRMTLARLPGVVGVKGCGAGLHDVFLVAGEFAADHPVYAAAKDFKLASLGTLEEHLW